MKKKIFSIILFLISYAAYANEGDESIERHDNEIEIIKEEQSALWEAVNKGTTLNSFGSLHFEKYNNSSFEFNTFLFDLELKSSIDKHIKLHSTIGLKGIQDAQGNDTLQIDVTTSFIDFIFWPALVFRAGIFLSPLTKFNLNYEDYKLNLVSHPMLAEIIAPSPLSDLGVGFTGKYDLIDNFLSLNYNAYIVNGFNDNISSGIEGFKNAEQHFGDTNSDKSYVSRVEFNVFDTLIFGGSYYYGKFDPRGTESISAYDFSYTARLFEFEVTGEYLVNDISGGISSTDGLPFPDKLTSYYTEVSYFMYPDFLEVSHDSRVNISFRYDRGKIENAQNNEETTYSICLGYNPYQLVKLKSEYQFNSGSLERGNNDGLLLAVAFKL